MPSSGEPNTPTVLVIGAGASGAAAAAMLARAGLRVSLVEARDRVGGRTYSAPFPLANGSVPVDLGASWIHGVENPELVVRGLISGRTQPTTGSVVFHPRDMKPLSMERSREVYKTCMLPYRRAEQVGAAFAGPGDAAEVDGVKIDAPVSAAYEEDWQLMVDALGSSDARELDLLKLKQQLLAGINGSPLSDLSSMSFVWNPRYESEKPDLFVVGGYQQVVDRLLGQAGLVAGDSLRLGEPVQRIEYGDDGATVTTSKGSYRANAVVCTIPLGVLQKNASELFVPPLPADRLESLGKFRMGTLDKVALRFEKCFWPKDVDLFEFYLPLPPSGLPSPGPVPDSIPLDNLRSVVAVNLQALHPDLDAPVLLCLSYTDLAARFEEAGEEAVAGLLSAHLGLLFGLDETPKCVASATGFWATDPFALGSYSFLPVGLGNPASYLAHRNRIAAPLGRVFFAGEHTSPDEYQSVHGAFNSGCRAAGEVVEALGWEAPDGWREEIRKKGGRPGI